VDDFVINVKQIGQYPSVVTTAPTDVALLQQGGIGGAYVSIVTPDLVSTALANGGWLHLMAGNGIAWNGAGLSSDGVSITSNVPLNVPSISSTGDIFVAGNALATQINVDELFDTIIENSVFSVNGRKGNVQLETDDILRAGAAPIANAHFGGYNTSPTPWDFRASSDQIATTAWVQLVLTQLVCGGSVVTSFNGRGGAVTLTTDDVNAAYAASIAPDWPTAPSPPLYDASTRIATTMFVDESVQDLRDQIPAFIFNTVSGFDFAPIDSPAFTGVPTAPTAAPGANTGQLATTAFVTHAVTASTTGVASFNTRTGAVTLTTADITGAGGAVLASPVFTGTPQAPTAAPGNSSTQIATTAFVGAATAGAGVSSFNTRSGAVTLTLADVTGAGGAPLASPTFTGAPAAPTATAGTSTTQIASTAFVAAAIAGFTGGVTSFNARTGAVTLQAADISAAGGAVLASPAFTGTPTAPTATAGTNTTQLATTAYVLAAIGTGGGVSSFNGRAGVVTFSAADLASVNGATYHQADAAPAFPSNTFWFDSVRGQLYVNYVDPISSASSWIIANSQVTTTPPVAARQLAGLILSTGSTPSVIFNIDVGSACSDDNTTMMALATAWTKALNGTFVAGSGNAGLDTGAVTVNTWYHVFLIMNPTSGATDVLVSTSATAPVMPSGFTKKRRIGSLKTSGSSSLIGFLQRHRAFYWTVPVLDINSAAVGTTPVSLTFPSIPLGVTVRPLLFAYMQNSGAGTVGLRLYSPDIGDNNIATWMSMLGGSISGATAYYAYGEGIFHYSNTAQQMRAYAGYGTTCLVIVQGWVDDVGM
jgi:hypothetical protein